MIGIDRYRAWGQLHNAVGDARGALDAFMKLGFEERRPALFDDAATGAALHHLVTDELRTLGTDDSLVVFFAGHGHTVTTKYADGSLAKRGYLIPVDAEPTGGGVGTWLSLDSWLREVAHLPPKHILVVLDACHSGIALDPVIRWRGEDVRAAEPLETLRARRSRRIITSALDNELAMDSGPIAGHSLFTGCLIEALTGGLLAKTGQPTATGSEIALHVQRRVSSFPSSKQTPDFGALELDNRGELIVELPQQLGELPLGAETIRPTRRTSAAPRYHGASSLLPPSGIDSIQPKRAKTAQPIATRDGPPEASLELGQQPIASAQPAIVTSQARAAPTTPPAQTPRASVAPAPPSTEHTPHAGDVAAPPQRASGVLKERPHRITPAEAAFFAALDRHDAERKRGRNVLTLVTADSMTAGTGWGTWAAARSHLTLVTEATGFDAAIASLLEQIPWLRTVRPARAKLASVAKLDVNAVDDALDTRSLADREAWIDEIAGHDLHARVSGWILSMLREPWGRVPDLATAPVQGGDLLATLCDLATPITVLFNHAASSGPWLERAIQTAAELVGFLPRSAVAVGASRDLATSVIRSRPESAALALARQGEVPLTARAPRVVDVARKQPEHVLHEALARDARTAGLFEPNVPVPTHDRDRAIVVDLVARGALLAVEIDNWHQLRDPQAYARDRSKDVPLQRAGFFVMRFLVEDIEERIEQTIDEIAIVLAGRRASGSFGETPQ